MNLFPQPRPSPKGEGVCYQEGLKPLFNAPMTTVSALLRQAHISLDTNPLQRPQDAQAHR